MSRCVRVWGMGWRVYPTRGDSARTGRAPGRHKNDEYAAVTPARPAFQRHEAHAEGNDTTPRLAHSESTERRVYKPQLRQKRKRSRSPAGPRRLGAATRISASLSRRLSAFFGSTPGQDPKAAKFAVLTPGPGMFVNVWNSPRVVIPPPTETPVFRRVSPCVRSFEQSRACTHFYL